jgi:hypothetical protein
MPPTTGTVLAIENILKDYTYKDFPSKGTYDGTLTGSLCKRVFVFIFTIPFYLVYTGMIWGPILGGIYEILFFTLPFGLLWISIVGYFTNLVWLFKTEFVSKNEFIMKVD